jgi:hypothetical protein
MRGPTNEPDLSATVNLKELGSGYIPLGAFLRRCIPLHVSFLAVSLSLGSFHGHEGASTPVGAPFFYVTAQGE